ncbi:hypothetical protein KJ570_03660 [Patescibacteria group bacterium]|nr:hypothetical protein [Patescibacteria group bacterium]
MKRKISNLGVFVNVAVLIFFGLFLSLVSAQEFDYTKAYQDFSYNLSLHDQQKSVYQKARSEYLQFGTLVSKETTKQETLKLLLIRDEVVKTYLTSLRMKIRELEGLSDSQKEGFYSRIDSEYKFFEEHKNKLSSAGSLDDLVDDSNEAFERHDKSSKIVIYYSLIGIASGKNSLLRIEIEKQISELKNKISEIRSNGDKDVSSMERSFTDLENKISRSKEKDNQALNMVNQIKTTERNKENIYNEALQETQDSFSYIKEVNNYLLEIINQIKTN